MTPSPIIPTAGRIVLFSLPEGFRRAGEVRPAIIVQAFGRDVANILVFMDKANDREEFKPETNVDVREFTSMSHDDTGAAGTWRWMDYQKGQAAKSDDIFKMTEKAYLGAVETLSKDYDAALVDLRKQVEELKASLAALNAKQPERQRLDVKDPTPVPADNLAKLDEQLTNEAKAEENISADEAARRAAQADETGTK